MNIPLATKHTAIGLVAGIAAYASYSHMRALALEHGQTSTVAALLPISVDGMLVVTTLVMREDRAAGFKVRPWAWIAFVLGVGASVIANVLAAADDVTSRVISAWPALALLLVIEVLATGKRPVVEVPEEASRVEEASGPVEVPGEEVKPRAPRKAAVKAVRRPVEVTRAMAEEALAEPGTTRTAVARKLAITPRRLREVLNQPSGELPVITGTELPVVNGHDVLADASV